VKRRLALSDFARDRPVEWQLRDMTLSTADHTLIMGVLNVTPDSFSDGGLDVDTSAAVARAMELVHSGADIVDVGGESTRPGADPVPVHVEMERVVPIVSEIAAAGAVVSIDTMKPAVAAAAVGAGAVIVNDVGGLRDPAMLEVVADLEAGVVIMHMRGEPRTMQTDTSYDDVVDDVAVYLEDRARLAIDAGIDPGRICLDPGIGFGKSHLQNLEILGNVSRYSAMGFPVLIGASRKAFLGSILGAAGFTTEPAERDSATAATVSAAVLGGAAVVRVHDVAGALQVARTTDAIVRGQLESRDTIGRT
jgi:dihydropteroate synthase